MFYIVLVGCATVVFSFWVLLTSASGALFKHSKRRNYSIKKVKCFNFQCIDYKKIQKKLPFKGLKECPGGT